MRVICGAAVTAVLLLGLPALAGAGSSTTTCTGVLAPEAVQGFHAIGQHKVAETVQAAMDVLGSPYPRDHGLRETILSRFSPRSFDALNEQFYALLDSEAGGFDAAADDYAARNGRLALPRNPSAGSAA